MTPYYIEEGKHYRIEDGRGNRIKLRTVNEWLGEIEELYVLPSERRKGIGSLLLYDIEAIARQKKLKKLSLICSSDNENAIKIYIKEGYEKEAVLKNHFRKGLDSFVFSKFM